MNKNYFTAFVITFMVAVALFIGILHQASIINHLIREVRWYEFSEEFWRKGCYDITEKHDALYHKYVDSTYDFVFDRPQDRDFFLDSIEDLSIEWED